MTNLLIEKLLAALKEIGKHEKFSEMNQESLNYVDSAFGHDYFISVARAAIIDEPIEFEIIRSSIDFTKIPNDIEGQWIVVRKSDQKLLAHGHVLRTTVEMSGVERGDDSVIISRVPIS